MNKKLLRESRCVNYFMRVLRVEYKPLKILNQAHKECIGNLCNDAIAEKICQVVEHYKMMPDKKQLLVALFYLFVCFKNRLKSK